MVYITTQDLLRRKVVCAERDGHAWVFYAVDDPARALQRRAPPVTREGTRLSTRQFEALARRVMGGHYGVLLSPGSVPGVRKKFGLVSPDGSIVGSAHYFVPVRGHTLPVTRSFVTAEQVWLLEKTGAPTTFLVFGSDRSVPTTWLERFGNLATSVSFFFLSDDGGLEPLRPGAGRS